MARIQLGAISVQYMDKNGANRHCELPPHTFNLTEKTQYVYLEIDLKKNRMAYQCGASEPVPDKRYIRKIIARLGGPKEETRARVLFRLNKLAGAGAAK